MTKDQTAKVAALDQDARTQYAESLRTLNPLANPDAPTLVKVLNLSSIPGSP